MFAMLLARTARMTAAIASAALLTAYVTVLPAPARAATVDAAIAARR